MNLRLSSFALLIPFFLLVITTLALSIPHSFLFFGKFSPLYNLIIVYYWYLLFPATLPLSLLFAFGILCDTMLGTPIGLTSVALILFQLFVGYYKKFLVKKSFNIIWLGFVLCSLYIILLQILITLVFVSYSWAQILALLQQWYVTCLLYPIIHHVFDLIANKLKILKIHHA